MRRSDRQIHDAAAIEDILRRAAVCRLAMSVDGRPYVVPLCFGYRENVLYFHCASEGAKLDIIRENDRVCFEVDIDCQFVRADEACGWSLKYRSVIGFGRAAIVDDPTARREALDVIMRHYADGPFTYSADAVAKTAIIQVDIESMTGKTSGY
jgi:uncharacterized protein